MADLNDQLKGVELDSPTNEDVSEEVSEETKVSTDAETEEKAEKSERTPENVYRETVRKLEKYETDNRKFQQDVFAQLQDINTKILEKLGDVAKAPAAQAKTIDDYSVAELTAHRDSLPENDPQRAQLDMVIADKIVNEKVDKRVAEATSQQRIENIRTEAIKEATQRYPDLAVNGSEFHRKVDARIRGMDEHYVRNNPRIVLDIANDVAIEEGIMAVSGRRTVRSPDKPGANKRDSAAPAPKEEKPELPMSEAEAQKIAKKLEKAMGRKFTKEEIQRIRENHSSYHQDRHLFTR
jgi:hypothetical protein